MKKKALLTGALVLALSAGSAFTSFAWDAGWVQDGAVWRFQNADGSYHTGWHKDSDGKWYYLQDNTIMKTGWFTDGNGNTFHLNTVSDGYQGAMRTGWYAENGKWFFFDGNGYMKTGLIKVDGAVYFMQADGSLFVGTMNVGGVNYNFTEYGTTNGAPAVGAEATYATKATTTTTKISGSSGGSSSGGSSSSGSTASKTVAAKVEAAVEKANASDSITASVEDKVITVSATEEDGTLLSIQEDMQAIFAELFTKNYTVTITAPNGDTATVTASSELVDAARALGLNGAMKVSEISDEYTVNVHYGTANQDYTVVFE